MTLPANPLPQLVPTRAHHLLNRLRDGMWRDRTLAAVRGGPVQLEPVDVKMAKGQRLVRVQPGEYFGPAGGGWAQRWFCLDIAKATAAERGKRTLQWDCDGEATAWIDGKPWSGLDVGHPYCVLPDKACTVWLDCGTYMTGIWAIPRRQMSPHGCQFQKAEIAIRDEAYWQAYHDVDALIMVMDRELKRSGYAGYNEGVGYKPLAESMPVLLRRLLVELDRACAAYDQGGIAALAPVLKRIYRTCRGSAWDGFADLCGHSHLDLVWLWPEMVTNRKGVHTFASVLRLMERYPEFRFSQSQPAIYEAVGDLAPSQLREIRQRIASGQWEATGALEVESDVTLPSGEGLARGFLYGQQRFADLRGGDISKVLWIPDVFGYSACLPQLMAQSGVEYFFTTKLSWSAITKFPHTSFRWRGPDGSAITTHLSPVEYNGTVALDKIAEPLEQNMQAGVFDRSLLPTGYGDGAGGPNETMCERARRFADLGGAPATGWSRVEDFFDKLAPVRDELPVYEGELYLEYHRGTYTTQSDLKRLYRGAERALTTHEAVRVLTGRPALPAERWLRTIFVQFHDAIPGSSIGRVYDELNPELAAIIEREQADTVKLLGGRGKDLTVCNPVAIDRLVTAVLPGRPAANLETASGAPVAVQKIGSGRGATWLARVPLDGLSVTSVRSGAKRSDAAVAADVRGLDNGIVQARFDRQGRLTGLTVRGEDVGLQRAGFQLYPDHPSHFDAWDIDRGTLALGEWLASAADLAVVETGPVRSVLAQPMILPDGSALTVRWILEAGADVLGVEVEAEWQVDHQLLKFHCQTDRQGRFARYGAPFGAVSRPQKPGYQSEESQWEVAGQRWAAVVDEQGAGLAMITEAKYGFSCRDGDLGLSLLRAPTHPDELADRGHHLMRLALGRHREVGSAEELSTAAKAEALYGDAPVAMGGKNRSAPFSVANWGSLVPAAIKPAEDGDGWILRLHEVAGVAGVVALDCAEAPADVERVDILERPYAVGRKHGVRGRKITIRHQPHEIIGLRIR